MKLSIDTAKISMVPAAESPSASATFISWPNRRERLWKAKKVWKELLAKERE
jgi:hypothetical protein